MRWLALATAGFAFSSSLVAQVTAPNQSRADTLRGSLTTPGRKWWDVTFYDLHVAIQPDFRVDDNFYVVPKLVDGRP